MMTNDDQWLMMNNEDDVAGLPPQFLSRCPGGSRSGLWSYLHQNHDDDDGGGGDDAGDIDDNELDNDDDDADVQVAQGELRSYHHQQFNQDDKCS